MSGAFVGTSLFYTDATGLDQEISFPVVTQRRPQTEISITDFPVETGGNITDHARALPATIDLEVSFSDNMGDDAHVGKSQEQYDKLENLAINGTLFTLFTTETVKENLLVTRISNTVSVQTADAIDASISLRQIRFTNTGVSLLFKKGSGAGKRSKTEKKELAPASTVDKTVVHQGLDLAADYLGVGGVGPR